MSRCISDHIHTYLLLSGRQAYQSLFLFLFSAFINHKTVYKKRCIFSIPVSEWHTSILLELYVTYKPAASDVHKSNAVATRLLLLSESLKWTLVLLESAGIVISVKRNVWLELTIRPSTSLLFSMTEHVYRSGLSEFSNWI